MPTPHLAAPSPHPARTGLVDVYWIAFAQVCLKVGKPAGEVSAQPSFSKETQAGRGVFANPLAIDEPTHVPASAVGNEAESPRVWWRLSIHGG
jgi:hypothetical protein